MSVERFYGDPVVKFRAMKDAASPADTIDGAHFRMWCGIAADEIEALRKERDAVRVERDRAMKACEQIIKRFTPKQIRYAPKDRLIIGEGWPAAGITGRRGKPQEAKVFARWSLAGSCKIMWNESGTGQPV